MKIRKRFKITTVLLLTTLLFSCAKTSSNDVVGSWVLDEVKGVKGNEKVTLDRENHASMYGGDYYYAFQENGKALLVQTDGTGASSTTESTYTYSNNEVQYNDAKGTITFIYDKASNTLTQTMNEKVGEYDSLEFIYKRKK